MTSGRPEGLAEQALGACGAAWTIAGCAPITRVRQTTNCRVASKRHLGRRQGEDILRFLSGGKTWVRGALRREYDGVDRWLTVINRSYMAPPSRPIRANTLNLCSRSQAGWLRV